MILYLLTDSKLVTGDNPPASESCRLPLTVKHILVQYANLRS